MSRFPFRSIAIALPLVFAGSRGFAQDTATAVPLAVTADVGLVSRYMWRGYDLARGGAAWQTNGSLTVLGRLTATGFGSSITSERGRLDEGQFGIAYQGDLKGLAWSLGYVAYLSRGEPATGEMTAALTRTFAGASATLTYARGNGAATGNSVNLWLERSLDLRAGRVTLTPYLQLDYLDAYGLPASFGERFTSAELGLPARLRAGALWLTATASLTAVPSGAVRADNRDAGARPTGLVPWFSLGVAYEH